MQTFFSSLFGLQSTHFHAGTTSTLSFLQSMVSDLATNVRSYLNASRADLKKVGWVLTYELIKKKKNWIFFYFRILENNLAI